MTGVTNVNAPFRFTVPATAASMNRAAPRPSGYDSFVRDMNTWSVIPW
jgi:hypothetical protein